MFNRSFGHSLARITMVLMAAAPAASVFPQAAPKDAELPITKVVLFSSGVGYFEHNGKVSGDSVVHLSFRTEEMNDALKSLIVRDGSGAASGSPSISYASRESLERALSGLRIDLSGAPDVAGLLARLRGAEVSIDTPQTQTGRIVGVEYRQSDKPDINHPYLVILGSSGLKSIAVSDIIALRFTDKRISEDFERALALILEARDQKVRTLDLRLPGSGTRNASIGYVVGTPVWKVSYRLDLSAAKPLLQGWAIVDNPTDQDWDGVVLSLVSGRPVSFIQDLYSPLRLEWPTIPLAIAGTASARSFESGYDDAEYSGAGQEESKAKKSAAPLLRSAPAAPAAPSYSLAESGAEPQEYFVQPNIETTQARSAGDQFEFTVKKPVSLGRRKSAMLPLVAGEISAQKVSIYNPNDGTKHPMLGAWIENSMGMKLPAGPITVFDGNVYAGDALLDFLPEKDKRLIVFGDDLGVLADSSSSSSEETTAVAVSKGIMIFSRRTTVTRTYTFKNSTAAAKRILIEHPITQGAELFEPKSYEEKTASVYRFGLDLPASSEAKFAVKERMPRYDRVTLASLSQDAFLSYSNSKEIPQAVRDALKKAVDLRKKADDAKRNLSELQARRQELTSDQARYRDNLNSVGRDSSQGQQYLKRLIDAENAIEQLDGKITEAKKVQSDTQKAYETYLSELSLGNL